MPYGTMMEGNQTTAFRRQVLVKQSLEHLKEIERDARRKLVLDAALELFAVKDFRSVTVREIAKQAGVSVGTIYNYYPTLMELFLDVFLTSAEKMKNGLHEMSKDGPPDLKALCRFHISFLNENMTFYQMMSHFMLGGELSGVGTEKLNQTMRLLMSLIENALQTAGHKKNLRLTAHTLFSALNGIMISYARYPGRTNEEIRQHTLRLADIVADVFDNP